MVCVFFFLLRIRQPPRPTQSRSSAASDVYKRQGMPASVRLMDMSGKSITDMQNVEFQRNSIVQMQAPKAKGMYFVEIRSGVRRYVGKVVVK